MDRNFWANRLLVVFSLIAGEHFFGILGALLAVPVLSLTQSLFLAGTKLDVAKLLNVELGKVLFTFVGHRGEVYRATFHPRK